MASFVYNRAKHLIFNQTLNLVTATVKVVLVKSSYTPNPDHDFVSELTPGTNELSGAGYSRLTLASKSITESDALNVAIFDAADISYTSINAGTAAYIVLMKDNGGADSGNDLIALIDTAATPIITNGTDLTIAWDANGIVQLADA